MIELIELLKSPEVWALIIGIPVLLRAVGEFLALIGRIIPGKDFVEKSGIWFKSTAGWLIKVLKFFGAGSAK